MRNLPCQGKGREFEPRLPLHSVICIRNGPASVCGLPTIAYQSLVAPDLEARYGSHVEPQADRGRAPMSAGGRVIADDGPTAAAIPPNPAPATDHLSGRVLVRAAACERAVLDLSRALEALPQRRQVGRHLLARLAADEKRDEELANAVAFEVNRDGQA
jgi:hypothetical protein